MGNVETLNWQRAIRRPVLVVDDDEAIADTIA